MKRTLLIAIIALALSPPVLAQLKNKKTVPNSNDKRAATQSEHKSAEARSKSTGLILEPDQGERMVRRWDLPMTIKVDPINGGSKQLLVGTEDIPPGRAIPVHKHSHCDELIVIQRGTGTAILGEKRQVVTAGAMIFIPENEWVGLENTGEETIRIIFIFSALGFDKYLRATSVPEGEKIIPFTPSELAEIRRRFKEYIIFRDE
jgi:quercetin dioxygenase-like cupin family protein